MPKDFSNSIANELLEVQRTLGWMDLVIGSINDAVYVTDKDSRIVFANQYFADIVEKPRVFLLGEVLEKIFPVQPATKLVAEFSGIRSDAVSKDGRKTGIYEWTAKDGKIVIFRVSSQQLSTTNQTVYLAQNITREYELSRMKSNFIDLASHQLRTPMTAVMTYAHMLNDGFGGDLTPAQSKISSTIIQSSERMIKLVNDLLTITRVQNSGSEPANVPVDMPGLFEQINIEVMANLEKKKLQWDLRLPPGMPELTSDPNLLHEVFSNLVVNAIQYTPEGGQISIRARAARKTMTVTVSDTGIGIPKHYLSEIFNQFSRADNAVMAFPDGTGLGLFIIKLLLEKVGGSITCTSQVGKGSKFTVVLPRL